MRISDRDTDNGRAGVVWNLIELCCVALRYVTLKYDCVLRADWTLTSVGRLVLADSGT